MISVQPVQPVQTVQPVPSNFALLVLAPAPPHLHNPLVHSPEYQVEYLLPVSPDGVVHEVLPEPLHLYVEHFLGGAVRVASTEDVPLDIEVVGTLDDMSQDDLRDLSFDAIS